ncbi:amino acid-binding ACT domain protein [Corynebacterium atypicum]|uniref:Amino acid-binding ACT domain protein n=1 Tax=Corynebacterium atypicum TaxID=191610 RepID=A0ABM5QND8_9CORY|nr:amino acid-binding ACT domain protein [Corynebacterium atypicum]AIG64273.1 amino acid-binding ACT domain protein [Corynebacterium atypicum]
MSYLIRVLLPDEPGSLGSLALCLGEAGADISSVDVVETFPDGTVMDDLVVSVPNTVMADVIVSAAQEADGVLVDSIRPFSGRVDRRGQIVMLAEVAEQAANHRRALEVLVGVLPRSMTSTWAIALKASAPVNRVTASQAAPADDGKEHDSLPINTPRILNPRTEDWIPHAWALFDSALAAAPLPGTDYVVIVGRTAGPDFLASEVSHLGNLAKVCGAILAGTQDAESPSD